MVFPQIIAAFLALFDAIGLPGNFLVIITIALQRKFHVMRCILLASLAVSDFLFLILVNSFRLVSISQERWLYGETMCYLDSFFSRYFYINTILHLIAVSYDRYNAIVKSPLTYSGMITTSKAGTIVLIWVSPIAFSIGPFLGWGEYVYNPEVFFCQQGWMVQGGQSSGWMTALALLIFVLPLLVIVLLNWSVYKTSKAQSNVVQIQIGSFEGSEIQQQDNSRRRIIETKAALDVIIIITVFLLCYFPPWILGLFRRVFKSVNIPPEAILTTSCIFMISSACNPIIYTIRKRDFRSGVKTMFLRRRIGLETIGSDIHNNVSGRATHSTQASASTTAATLATQRQQGTFLEGTGKAAVNVKETCPPIPKRDEQ